MPLSNNNSSNLYYCFLKTEAYSKEYLVATGLKYVPTGVYESQGRHGFFVCWLRMLIKSMFNSSGIALISIFLVLTPLILFMVGSRTFIFTVFFLVHTIYAKYSRGLCVLMLMVNLTFLSFLTFFKKLRESMVFSKKK